MADCIMHFGEFNPLDVLAAAAVQHSVNTPEGHGSESTDATGSDDIASEDNTEDADSKKVQAKKPIIITKTEKQNTEVIAVTEPTVSSKPLALQSPLNAAGVQNATMGANKCAVKLVTGKGKNVAPNGGRPVVALKDATKIVIPNKDGTSKTLTVLKLNKKTNEHSYAYLCQVDKSKLDDDEGYCSRSSLDSPGQSTRSDSDAFEHESVLEQRSPAAASFKGPMSPPLTRVLSPRQTMGPNNQFATKAVVVSSNGTFSTPSVPVISTNQAGKKPAKIVIVSRDSNIQKLISVPNNAEHLQKVIIKSPTANSGGNTTVLRSLLDNSNFSDSTPSDINSRPEATITCRTQNKEFAPKEVELQNNTAAIVTVDGEIVHDKLVTEVPSLNLESATQPSDSEKEVDKQTLSDQQNNENELGEICRVESPPSSDNPSVITDTTATVKTDSKVTTDSLTQSVDTCVDVNSCITDNTNDCSSSQVEHNSAGSDIKNKEEMLLNNDCSVVQDLINEEPVITLRNILPPDQSGDSLKVAPDEEEFIDVTSCDEATPLLSADNISTSSEQQMAACIAAAATATTTHTTAVSSILATTSPTKKAAHQSTPTTAGLAILQDSRNPTKTVPLLINTSVGTKVAGLAPSGGAGGAVTYFLVPPQVKVSSSSNSNGIVLSQVAGGAKNQYIIQDDVPPTRLTTLKMGKGMKGIDISKTSGTPKETFSVVNTLNQKGMFLTSQNCPIPLSKPSNNVKGTPLLLSKSLVSSGGKPQTGALLCINPATGKPILTQAGLAGVVNSPLNKGKNRIAATSVVNTKSITASLLNPSPFKSAINIPKSSKGTLLLPTKNIETVDLLKTPDTQPMKSSQNVDIDNLISPVQLHSPLAFSSGRSTPRAGALSGRNTPIEPTAQLTLEKAPAIHVKMLGSKIIDMSTPEDNVMNSKTSATTSIGNIGSLSFTKLDHQADRGVKSSSAISPRTISPLSRAVSPELRTVSPSTDGFSPTASGPTSRCHTPVAIDSFLPSNMAGEKELELPLHSKASMSARTCHTYVKKKHGQQKDHASQSLPQNQDDDVMRLHPIIDHDYCMFTEFNGEIQSSIIATTESKLKTERKYSKKTKAARTKMMHSPPPEKLQGRKKRKYTRRIPLDKLKQKIDPLTQLSTESQSSMESMESPELDLLNSSLVSAPTSPEPMSPPTPGEKEKPVKLRTPSKRREGRNYVKITGSYQDEFVYFATKKTRGRPRKYHDSVATDAVNSNKNPLQNVSKGHSSQVGGINVFDWYRDLSNTDKSSRFGVDVGSPSPSTCGDDLDGNKLAPPSMDVNAGKTPEHDSEVVDLVMEMAQDSGISMNSGLESFNSFINTDTEQTETVMTTTVHEEKPLPPLPLPSDPDAAQTDERKNEEEIISSIGQCGDELKVSCDDTKQSEDGNTSLTECPQTDLESDKQKKVSDPQTSVSTSPTPLSVDSMTKNNDKLDNSLSESLNQSGPSPPEDCQIDDAMVEQVRTMLSSMGEAELKMLSENLGSSDTVKGENETSGLNAFLGPYNQEGGSNLAHTSNTFDLEDIDDSDLLPMSMAESMMPLGELTTAKPNNKLRHETDAGEGPSSSLNLLFNNPTDSPLKQFPDTTPTSGECTEKMQATIPDNFGDKLDRSELFPDITHGSTDTPQVVNPGVVNMIPPIAVDCGGASPPELTIVSMYWNDLPGLVIKGKQHVRLVDIHKQMLPAKDTGILKKRCQMMSLEILNCSELQRDFLIRYANAAKSKSTVVVSKEDAETLVSFYVDPRPRAPRQHSTEHINTQAMAQTSSTNDSPPKNGGKVLSLKLKKKIEEEKNRESLNLSVGGKVKRVQKRRHQPSIATANLESAESKRSERSGKKKVNYAALHSGSYSDSSLESSPEKMNPHCGENLPVHEHLKALAKIRQLRLASLHADKPHDEHSDNATDASPVVAVPSVPQPRIVFPEEREIRRLRTKQKKHPLIRKEREKLKKLREKLRRKLRKLRNEMDKVRGIKAPKASRSKTVKPLQDTTRIIEISRPSLKGEHCFAVAKLVKPDQEVTVVETIPENIMDDEMVEVGATEFIEVASPTCPQTSIIKEEVLLELPSEPVVEEVKEEPDVDDIEPPEGVKIETPPILVLHRDNTNRSRGRWQEGYLRLDDYISKDASCIECTVCRELFSVKKFTKHLHHQNQKDELCQVSLVQKLEPKCPAPMHTWQVWEEFEKRKKEFESVALKVKEEKFAVKQNREHQQSLLDTQMDRVLTDISQEQMDSPKSPTCVTKFSTSPTLLDKTPEVSEVTSTPQVIENNNTVVADTSERTTKKTTTTPKVVVDKHVSNKTPVTSRHVSVTKGTPPSQPRQSGRVRKRKQLHPMESYVYGQTNRTPSGKRTKLTESFEVDTAVETETLTQDADIQHCTSQEEKLR